MKDELQSYLHEQFSELFPTQPKIQCEDGWFFLILWTCRFLDSYKRQYEKINFPNKLESAEILQIKNENRLLKIKCEKIKQTQQSFIDTVEFLSGFICEKTGTFFNNLVDLSENKTINETLANPSSTNMYIDNKKLRELINKNFNTDE